jgi:hypothetical protein
LLVSYFAYGLFTCVVVIDLVCVTVEHGFTDALAVSVDVKDSFAAVIDALYLHLHIQAPPLNHPFSTS